jgi:hypothetical protein
VAASEMPLEPISEVLTGGGEVPPVWTPVRGPGAGYPVFAYGLDEADVLLPLLSADAAELLGGLS